MPAADAYVSVLELSGSRPWDRNADDSRIIAGVKARSLKVRDRVGTWPRYSVFRRAIDIQLDPVTEEELDAALVLFER